VKPLYLLTLWSLMALVLGNELRPWAPVNRSNKI
jgi:hypothetical protein